MLILGIFGCGKFLIVKIIFCLWGLFLLWLDMGWVYDGLMVGRLEVNLWNVFRIVELILFVILFIDELDKVFVGSTGLVDFDGGIFSWIFGLFLIWM